MHEKYHIYKDKYKKNQHWIQISNVHAFLVMHMHIHMGYSYNPHFFLPNAGNVKLKTSLQPCCAGVSKDYLCGNVDKSGKKRYIVCENPKLSFFWDNIHPSQNGWHAVFSELQSSLRIIRE